MPASASIKYSSMILIFACNLSLYVCLLGKHVTMLNSLPATIAYLAEVYLICLIFETVLVFAADYILFLSVVCTDLLENICLYLPPHYDR